jgi:hypothetical protein
MAQRVSILVLCDIDEVEGAESTEFAFRGNSYEIDLCSTHLREMEEALTPYTLSARRIGRARKAAVSTRPARAAAPAPRAASAVVDPNAPGVEGKDARARVRQWAVEQGYEIGERGRIPKDIYNLYENAHA